MGNEACAYLIMLGERTSDKSYSRVGVALNLLLCEASSIFGEEGCLSYRATANLDWRRTMKPKDVDKIVKDLWPIGCLEDGDNDPQTIYLDGYCKGLKNMATMVKKLLKQRDKEC